MVKNSQYKRHGLHRFTRIIFKKQYLILLIL